MTAPLLALLLLAGAPASPAQPPPCHPPAAQAAPAAAEPERANLYDLQLSLVDQHGQPAKLDRFRGQPVLVSMFYGTCTTACPLLVGKVKRLKAKLSPKAKAATRVLLVSFDPARDRPPALKKLASGFGLDERWALAQTPAGSVRELAAALGIRYRFLGDGSLNHSSVLTLLGPDGTILARIDGLDAPDEALVARLEALAQPLRAN